MTTNITIKQISYVKGINSRLEFSITGVDNTIVNSMRRICVSCIPIYSFNNIKISENTSIYNNNYMKLRLRNLPVIGIMADDPIYVPKEKKVIVEEEITDNIMIQDDIDMETNGNLNSSSLKQLTMYLDITNTTNEIITVGTDNCKFYHTEKQIESPYTLPFCNNVPIIKLQPKQKIKLSAITELGIEEESSIFSPISIFTFKLIKDTYEIALESRGQLDEKKILQFIYDNLIHRLNKFLILVQSTSINNNLSGKILVEDIDHTLGNLISNGLMNHKKIKSAGYNMPHLLDNKILFHYELHKEDSIIDIIKDVVNKCIETFTNINNLIQKNIKLN